MVTVNLRINENIIIMDSTTAPFHYVFNVYSRTENLRARHQVRHLPVI